MYIIVAISIYMLIAGLVWGKSAQKGGKHPYIVGLLWPISMMIFGFLNLYDLI